MIEPEFPEDHGAYDAAGNYLGEGETWPRKSTVVDFAAPKLSTTENAAMDIKAIQKDRETGSCYQYKTFDELSAEPVEKRWLIKGIFARGETSAWIAPPGAMKSALMAEASICVAAGHNWHGYRNKGEAGVVYFALERSDLVNRRLRAHALRQNLKGLPIFVSSAVIDLTNPEAFKKVIDTVRNIQARHNVSVGLIIVDTFAKLIAAAGGDENSARDQGQVFANVQRVKNSINAHVALIGHTGKDTTRGARGSNAILGDVDVMVELSGEDIRTATVTKANDAPEGQLFSFKSEVHEFSKDEDGDPVSVNIVSAEEVSRQSASKPRDRWPKGLKLVHEAITEALLRKPVQHRVGGDGPPVTAVDVLEARSVHAQRYVSAGQGDPFEAERKAWQRNFKAARERDLISAENFENQALIWLVAA
jgi:hypothetical protein